MIAKILTAGILVLTVLSCTAISSAAQTCRTEAPGYTSPWNAEQRTLYEKGKTPDSTYGNSLSDITAGSVTESDLSALRRFRSANFDENSDHYYRCVNGRWVRDSEYETYYKATIAMETKEYDRQAAILAKMRTERLTSKEAADFATDYYLKIAGMPPIQWVRHPQTLTVATSGFYTDWLCVLDINLALRSQILIEIQGDHSPAANGIRTFIDLAGKDSQLQGINEVVLMQHLRDVNNTLKAMMVKLAAPSETTLLHRPACDDSTAGMLWGPSGEMRESDVHMDTHNVFCCWPDRWYPVRNGAVYEYTE